ncbi:MAG TPA: hypothetical protein VK357_01055, partial [Rubrobacteraceae bacterium]|nr:hypothetical protein [Rubrobacteraceae bacterium]
ATRERVPQAGIIRAAGAVISNEGPFVDPGHHWLFDPSQEQHLGFNLNYYCPSSDQIGNGQLELYNFTSNTMHLLWDDGSANPVFSTVTPSEEVYWWQTSPSGEHLTFQVMQGVSSGVVTVEVFTLNRANDCYVRTQALVTPR